MGSKARPGKYDCYANALPDEPMFVLLARDPSAPELVEAWAIERMDAVVHKMRPWSDLNIVAEAFDCANKMRDWREQNDGKWRLPKPEIETSDG